MADTNNAPIVYRRRATDRVGLQKIGSDELVIVNGKYGLFTPLTDSSEEPATEKNLQEIVEILRNELSKSQIENSKLKKQLAEALEKPPRTPDDFVTAIQHSVDSLQSKLSNMKNPVSDFVVSEFTIDTKVFVDVNDYGTVDYRFVQPGDDYNPDLLSKLSLKIQPVPKQTQAGTLDHANFTPFMDIDEIQGIGESYKATLRSKNIYTVSDLLHVGTRVRSRVELASLLGVEQRHLGEWIGNAELMTVKDIDGHAAEILFETGVSDLEALSTQVPEELLEKYNQRVSEKDQQNLKPATEEQIKQWVATAKLYVGQRKDKSSEE